MSERPTGRDAASPGEEEPAQRPAVQRLLLGWHYNPRFLVIWGALALLLLVSLILARDALNQTAIKGVLPFAGFTAIAAMGHTFIIINRGLDLSSPATVTLMGVVILNVTNGANSELAEALILCILLAAFIGFFIGFFIAVFDLNPIVVTLATASIVTGALIWWRSRTSSNDTVPTALADFGAMTPLGINIAIFVALGLMVLTTLALHYTPMGRRFTSVGANPEAAYIVGIPVTRYVIGGYTMGAIFFGFTGIMVSAFLKTPTTTLGAPYLLAPIAAVVLGGTSIYGGVGSMVASFVGAVFFTQLAQTSRVLGLPTSGQLILQGAAIAVGMMVGLISVRQIVANTRDRLRRRPPEMPSAAAAGDS